MKTALPGRWSQRKYLTGSWWYYVRKSFAENHGNEGKFQLAGAGDQTWDLSHARQVFRRSPFI